MPMTVRTASDRDPRCDADLVHATRRRDSGAFEALYARYAPVVHGIILGRLAAHDADDVVQNVFITALTKLESLREPAAFAGWICRVARNAAEDFRRGSGDTLQLDEEYASRATQSQAAEAAAALATIRALPEAYRETLMLRLVEGMTGAEIAERTGLTPGSVRVNLHRGMQLLRDALEKRP
jgi:RNA polymerase sigma-70 factor (ECF subfamily)